MKDELGIKRLQQSDRVTGCKRILGRKCERGRGYGGAKA